MPSLTGTLSTAGVNEILAGETGKSIQVISMALYIPSSDLIVRVLLGERELFVVEGILGQVTCVEPSIHSKEPLLQGEKAEALNLNLSDNLDVHYNFVYTTV